MLVLVSVTVITLDETGRAAFLTSGVKSVASDVYGPLRRAVNGVLDPVGRFFAGAFDYGSLERENQKLRAEIDALEHRGATDAAAQRQYEQLQKLLAMDELPSLASLTEVPAEVTAQNVSNFAATVTIDKGRTEGVHVGYPVVGPGGLVGQVVATTHSGATVRLLTDGASRIGVSFGHDEEATLQGVGADRPLQIQYVPSTAPVSVGELIATSGLEAGTFPPGIPVAEVSSVHGVVGAADQEIAARPLAHLNELTYVEVVQWSPSS